MVDDLRMADLICHALEYDGLALPSYGAWTPHYLNESSMTHVAVHPNSHEVPLYEYAHHDIVEEFLRPNIPLLSLQHWDPFFHLLGTFPHQYHLPYQIQLHLGLKVTTQQLWGAQCQRCRHLSRYPILKLAAQLMASKHVRCSSLLHPS